jgi:hypothetical protein
MLLAQVARDIAPLKDALQAAIDYVQTLEPVVHRTPNLNNTATDTAERARPSALL